jgi:death-on-curing protein
MAWRWLLERVVSAMHDELIAEHGGSPGVRDAGLLSLAMARPQNRATYGKPSVFDLAASYAFGIARNRPFVDGNESTSFLAACVFLEINGWEVTASESEVVAAALDLAADEMDESGFSYWIKGNSLIRPERKR